MTKIELNYKGLTPEDRVKALDPSTSGLMAKGTFYEAWFETLKSSPWYKQMGCSGNFGSEGAHQTWELFGDLAEREFEEWWLDVGFQIFAEPDRYKEFKEINYSVKLQKPKKGAAPTSVMVEIPLNLTSDGLHKLLDKFLNHYEGYRYEANRWSNSKALAHLSRDSRHDPRQIIREMKLYREYERQKTEANISYDQFAIKEGLNRLAEKDSDFEMGKRKLISSTNDLLERCRMLMAYATEGIFPPDIPGSTQTRVPDHAWTKKGNEYYIPKP